MGDDTWLLLQLTCSSFPSGGFAHSGGLEAAVSLGGEDDLDALFDQCLWQAGRAVLPFVRASAAAPERLAEFDRALDVTTAGAVQNRASRTLGRSLAAAAARIFDGDGVRAVAAHARVGPAHHGPVYGALFGALGLAPRTAATTFLHGTAKNFLSAAVRLGQIGPLEAQRLLGERRAVLDRVLARGLALDVEEAASSAPVLELWGSAHDALDARLFQS